MTWFDGLRLSLAGRMDDAMTLKLPSQKTPLQSLAQRAMVVVCAVLALGVIGSVAVRGSQPDESPRHTQPLAPLPTHLHLSAEDAAQMAGDDVSAVPVRFASDTATQTALRALSSSRAAHVGHDTPEAPAKPRTGDAMAVHNGSVHIRIVRMEVTAYCPCKVCCGPKAQGITASGKRVSYNNGLFVAADTSVLPFGTKIIIPGYSTAPVEVIDRGGAIKGNKLDVFFPTHQQALNWGRRFVMVTVIE